MWWTAVKIAGIVSAVLVTLAFLAFLVLVTRPAVLLGVSESSLSSSMTDERSGAGCEKNGSGDWQCELYDGVHYRVDVNWMGCWEAERADGAHDSRVPDERQGCIGLGDMVTFD